MDGVGLDESTAQLKNALMTLDSLDSMGSTSAEARLAQRLSTVARAIPSNGGTEEKPTSAGQGSTIRVTYAPSYQEDHALSQAADFDNRLTVLEAALGLEHVPLPSLDNGDPKPLLPTIDVLNREISILSSTSPSSIDSMGKRVRQLTQEAMKLGEARKSAKAAQDALHSGQPDDFHPTQPAEAVISVGEGLEDPEQLSKINALYGTLPTIEALAPLLPSVLDRLRSLRLIHANAASASESLGRVEQRLAETEEEIKSWRDGLEKVEGIIKDGEGKMGANMKVVEGWVKELEERMGKLEA